MSKELTKTLKKAVLRRMAGGPFYARGADYHLDGRVTALAVEGDGVRAKVRGDADYEVELSAEDGILDYSCTCPIGSDGVFCAHAVAAGLACAEHLAAAGKKRKTKPKALKLDEVRKILLADDHERFVDAVLRWAEKDKDLERQLLVYGSERADPEVRFRTVREAFEQAARPTGLTNRGPLKPYIDRVDAAIDPIEKLLSDGFAIATVEIVEHGLRKYIEAVDKIGDYKAQTIGLRDRLLQLHWEACQASRPDPEALAVRLMEIEIDNWIGVFTDSVLTYADLLGTEGVAAYRNAVEAHWKNLPRPDRFYDEHRSRRSRISRAMENAASLCGADEFARVAARDLSGPQRYYLIAALYRDEGDFEKALEWADKGLRKFPDEKDPGLLEIISQAHIERGRSDEAMEMLWESFREEPRLQTYIAIEKAAASLSCWPEWQDRLMQYLREGAGRPGDGPRRGGSRDSERFHTFVSVLAYEGNIEEAEAEYGLAFSVAGFVLEEVIEAAATTRPVRAAELLLYLLGPAIEDGKAGYEDAVMYLVNAGRLLRQAGRGEDFQKVLDKVREDHKRKRSLMRMLDERAADLSPG